MQPDASQSDQDARRIELEHRRREGRAANASLLACGFVSVALFIYGAVADDPAPWVEQVQHGTCIGCILLMLLTWYELYAVKKLIAELEPENDSGA